jgi:putative phage-type endonuclease
MTWHGVPIEHENEAAWLEARRDGIGASDVSGIVGLSPYASPFSVWADKIHGTYREPTYGMQLGKKLESIILESFEDVTGLHVQAISRQLHIAHPQFEWAQATLDGLAFDHLDDDSHASDAIGVVEAKTDGRFKRWKKVPDHHVIQVQWQMYVSGLERGWLAALHGGRLFEVYEIEKDLGIQEQLVTKVSQFRAKHLMIDPLENNGEPLPPDADDHRATSSSIAELWHSPADDEVIDLSKAMAADVTALLGLKIGKADIDAQIRKVSARIKIALRDAAVGNYGGRTVVTWKKQTREGYYVDPHDFRVLRTPKPKETP